MDSAYGLSVATDKKAAVLLDDYEERARISMAKDVFDYIEGWAGDGVTYRSNRTDYDSLRLLPLVMRDVSRPVLDAFYFNRVSPLPFGFSPTAFHQLAHPLGELATAQASHAMGVPMIVSSMSSRSMEDIAAEAEGSRLWLHVYLFRDRGVTRELISRAEAAGYEAISVGLGCPVVGKRPANLRNRFSLPKDIEAANFSRQLSHDHNNPIASLANAELDPSVTWKDVESLCAETRLPVIGKGIMNASDVTPALGCGLQALMVSNHGGRQLDGSVSSIRALPEIAAAVDGRIPVLLDGGVRRGTDALKALLLGADAVFMGRPVLWALSAGGAQGVIDMVSLLADELRLALQLCGCNSLPEAKRTATTLLR
jgi:isopentenyl diphosphate isomerase/L-lactate dehydrogenase-like FMN-dependent dehydrogenase